MPMSALPPAIPTDPLVSFRACHDRIRSFTAGLGRVAALPDLADARVPEAAGRARRYFGEGLPLHAADEDLSLAPRLRAVVPTSGPLLDELARDHHEIDAILATLLPLLDTLADGQLVPLALLRDTVAALSALLLAHIAREEDELFPLCTCLSEGDRLAIAREIVARRA